MFHVLMQRYVLHSTYYYSDQFENSPLMVHDKNKSAGYYLLCIYNNIIN